MNILTALILSFVEGISEFLPISSTAHLVLVSKIVGVAQTDFTKSFEIIIQLGAILAVVVLYYRKFLVDRKLLANLFVALIPALGVGFVFYSFIKKVLIGDYIVTLLALLIGGIILILIETYFKKMKLKTSNLAKLDWKNSLIIGVFQSVSVIPGVSRAAATIIGGMLTGLDRSSATEFSFFLAVPTMLAATILDVYKSRHELAGTNFLFLAVGFTGSFVFALIAVKFLINYVKTHNFISFGIYRIIVSIFYFFLFIRF